MTYEDELWNLAFSNVGRKHGEPKNQRDVSRAIQAISGIGPPTNQQRQRTTGMCQYNPCAKMLTRRRRRESNPTSFSCSYFPTPQECGFLFKDIQTVLRNTAKLSIRKLAAQLEEPRKTSCR